MAEPLNWDLLISERDSWVAHNFPDPDGSRTPLDSVLGVIEELGELTHAHLKQAQSIRGDDHEHEANAQDAIGDLTVYLLGVMAYHRVRPMELRLTDSQLTADGIILQLAYRVGLLAYKSDPVGPIVSSIVSWLRRYCHVRQWDYNQIVQGTWDSVKQRDWIKYPGTGLPTEAPV